MARRKLPDHLAFLDGCNVGREVIERLDVVRPMERAEEVMAALHERGYSIRRSGPYTDRKMWPKVDVTRFQYEAEREVDR